MYIKHEKDIKKRQINVSSGAIYLKFQTRIFRKLTAKNKTSAKPVIPHEKIYRR